MSTIDPNKQAVEFVARWAWREPSNPDKPISDAERLSAIKYHPTIKAAWSGAAEGNEAEAAAPKPDPAIAELVEEVLGVGDAYVAWYEPMETPKPGLIIDASLSVMDKAKIGDRFYSQEQVDRLVAALTASNKSVAELERERDEARDRARILGDKYNQWFERAKALEAELAHLQSAQPVGDRPESEEAGRTLLNQEQSNGD